MHQRLHASLAALVVVSATLVTGCKDDPPQKLTINKPRIVELSKDAAADVPDAATPAEDDTGKAGPGDRTFSEPTVEQQTLIDSAKKALDAGDTTAAIKAFSLLRKTQPMSGAKLSGMIALADLAAQSGDTAEALTILEEADEQAPPTAELAFVLGRTYKERGDLDKAIAQYERALKLQPLLLQVHVELGGLYQKKGDNEASAAAFLAYEREVYKFAKLLESQDTHKDDKLKIVEAFSFLPDDRANASLVLALRDRYREVRLASAMALSEVGTRAAIPEMKIARDNALVAKDQELADVISAAITKIEKQPVATGDDTLGPDVVKGNTPPTKGD